MNEEGFRRYYEEYLGIERLADNGDINLIYSKYRDMPINKRYFHKMIATNYNGMKIASVSTELNQLLVMSLLEKMDCDVMSHTSVPNCDFFTSYKISYMDRMTLERTDDSIYNFITEKNSEVDYTYLNKYKKYIALDKSQKEIIGYCKVSDVISGFGNLVVWVDEKKRRRGIAEKLTRQMIKKCYEDNIEPVYLVREENVPSISLAKKLGFCIRQRELVVSREG
jgi:ribosomal protein S18 acetylase RimI-like enzyme